MNDMSPAASDLRRDAAGIFLEDQEAVLCLRK